MLVKSDKMSKQLREAGNICVEKKEYNEALVNYNASLCYAKSKEFAAFAYANRSVVYLEIGMYCESLENIKWAQEHNYPKDKISKLIAREKYCHQKITGSETSKVCEDYEKAVNFFKLSHPPNPRNSSIADCLEYRLNDNGKMGIFTKIDLKAGDMIAMEKPVHCMVFDNAKYKRCIMCYTTKKFNLIPYKDSVSIMFCSESCKSSFNNVLDESFDDLNDVSQTSLDILKSEWAKNLIAHKLAGSMREHEKIWKGKLKKTIFNYDMNETISKKAANISNCIASLSSKPFQVDVSRNPNSYVEAFTNILSRNMKIMFSTEISEINNSSYLICKNHLSSLSILLPLFNHDCCYNIDLYSVDNMNVLMVNRPILANSELFITILRDPNCEYQYRCECIQQNYEGFICNPRVPLSDVDKCIEQLKTNWNNVSKIYEKYPWFPHHAFTKENFIIISSIAHRITYPCFPSSLTDPYFYHTLKIED